MRTSCLNTTNSELRDRALKGAVVVAFAALSLVMPEAANAKKKAAKESVESQLKFKEGDEVGNELKALKTEMLVMKTEKRALNQLKKLHAKYKGTRMEPEILFRLAEIYMRRARTNRFFEVHRESNQVMSFVPTLVKEASEAKEIRGAIAQYEELQRRFPDFRQMDVVIFNTAFARQQLGEDQLAEKLFGKLITEHPDSMLVPDSELAIGEINYNRRSFQVALTHFLNIKKYPQARVYPYGMYKAAWCHYNMQDAASAMKQLEQVVLFGREIAEKKMDSKLDLRKEALNDLATFYGDVMPSAKAVEYFMAQAQGLDPAPFVMRLSELYDRHSRFGDVEVVLKGMLKAMPKSSSAAIAHEQLIWNYERMKKRAEAVTQLTEMNAYCVSLPKTKKAEEPEKADGKVLGSGPSGTRDECQEKIADASKKLATKWHGLWQKKTPSDDLAAASEQAYKLYLDQGAGANDADLGKIRYSYAEILFQRKNYRESSNQYALVQDAKPDKTLSHDASYGAIVALEKSNDNKWNDKDEKHFVELSDVYLKKHADGPYALELQFKRSFIAYEKGRYDEAAVGFRKIGWENTVTDKNKERVLKAQDLYLDILNIKKDYATLKDAAQTLVKKGIADAPRLQSVEKIYREAYFAQIQQMEEKGDLNGAVKSYKAFALENKSADLASKAWWNASQLQFRMGDAQGGAATCQEMHKLFPTSPMGKDCLTKAAQTFEASGRLETAARVLLNLATLDEENADKWREVSADFFALSGNRDRAIEMYAKLEETTKAQDKRMALIEKSMDLAKLSGDTNTLRKLQTKILSFGAEPATSRIQLEQADETFAKKDYANAFAQARKILGRSIPKDLQAHARFIQAQVLEEEFRAQSVKSRIERVATVLAIKTEKLDKAQQAYQEVIKYGDPEHSVKALRKLADCYMHYVAAVRGMQMPAGMSEADTQAFKGELDALVIPMEEKGIDTLNQALQTARKAEIHDGTIVEIQKDINKVNMNRGPASSQELKPPAIVLPSFSGRSSEVGS